MNENEKYHNSFLTRIIKYVSKVILEIESKERQLSSYASTKNEREALLYSKDQLVRLKNLIDSRRDV